MTTTPSSLVIKLVSGAAHSREHASINSGEKGGGEESFILYSVTGYSYRANLRRRVTRAAERPAPPSDPCRRATRAAQRPAPPSHPRRQTTRAAERTAPPSDPRRRATRADDRPAPPRHRRRRATCAAARLHQHCSASSRRWCCCRFRSSSTWSSPKQPFSRPSNKQSLSRLGKQPFSGLPKYSAKILPYRVFSPIVGP